MTIRTREELVAAIALEKDKGYDRSTIESLEYVLEEYDRFIAENDDWDIESIADLCRDNEIEKINCIHDTFFK